MSDEIKPRELLDEEMKGVAGGRTSCEPVFARKRKHCHACRQFVFRERIEFKPVTGTPWDDEFEMGIETWRCEACGDITTSYAPIARRY